MTATLDRSLDDVPHPPRRVFLLGDVLGASPSRGVQDSTRMAAELGPIFGLKILGRRILVVSGSDMVKELCDERNYSKFVSPAVAGLRGLGGDGLFTAHGDEPNWAKAHTLLAPAFTKSAMQSYHSTMLEAYAELDQKWSEKRDVDVSADMTRLTLETIGRTAMGFGFDSFERSTPHPFVTAMIRALQYAQKKGALGEGLLGRLMTVRGSRQNAADEKYVFDVVDEVIRARRASPEPHPQDLLELMLDAAHASPELEIDERNIRYQLVTFLIAGHETTSGALSFALYYLSKNADVLRRAQAEVDSVWSAEEQPRYDQVAKLRYVRQVLDETLRLWPTAPAFGRQARFDTTLGDTYKLHKGDWAYVLLTALHRQPVWGENTEEFDPERFAPSAIRSRPAHVYKPFGTGERACIGRQFAIHEAVLVLGKILQNYDLVGDPRYQLRIHERLTLMPRDFRLTLTPRRQ